ncbi:glycoside hydrolase family 26 protein [Candidatus Omnitrophota bacterium]
MKKFLVITGIVILAFILFAIFNKPKRNKGQIANNAKEYCLTGAFIGDRPSRKDIMDFKRDYGKKPYFVMIFVDWDNYPDLGSIKAILEEESGPLITWEPWEAASKRAVDYDKLLQGGYDKYITDFARLIKSFKVEIFLRFAHEMNGNWYPWSGSKIGVDKYKDIYKHVKDIFDEVGVENVEWVFSVNWEDVPPIKANNFLNYYPGDAYVDYVGIDGYNWGNTQSWSRWITFRDLFYKTYDKIREVLKKPVLISEFSSASSGGDKSEWIRNAMQDMKEVEGIKGFVIFNVNKEVDWSFPVSEKPGKEFKEQLGDPYFKGIVKNDE